LDVWHAMGRLETWLSGWFKYLDGFQPAEVHDDGTSVGMGEGALLKLGLVVKVRRFRLAQKLFFRATWSVFYEWQLRLICLDVHFACVCSQSFYMFCKLRRVEMIAGRGLCQDVCLRLFHVACALLQHCLLAGSPYCMTDRLQWILNAAARLVSDTWNSLPDRLRDLTLSWTQWVLAVL